MKYILTFLFTTFLVTSAVAFEDITIEMLNKRASDNATICV
jgi:hypothetical protein